MGQNHLWSGEKEILIVKNCARQRKIESLKRKGEEKLTSKVDRGV